MGKKHPIVCFFVAVAFVTYTIMAATPAFAAPKETRVEVKKGTVTGLVTDLDKKPLPGQTIQILDTSGKVKHSAITDKDGKYKIAGIESGTYTMIIAKSQKVTLLVKEDSNNTIINAVLPTNTQPYSAGATAEELGLGSPVAIAIAGGVVLVGAGVGIYFGVKGGGEGGTVSQ